MPVRRRAVWARVDGPSVVGLDLIVIWSGSLLDIPSGWKLCDGTNATPDLRDRFVLGSYDEMALDHAARRIGSSTGVIRSHNHGGLVTDDEQGHVHPIPQGFGAGSPLAIYGGGGGGAAEHTHGGWTPPADRHYHQLPFTLGHADNLTVDTRPPYYALAYIMGKGDLPLGGLGLMYVASPYGTWVWNGSNWVWQATTLPSGYAICDGSNGTPDLYEQYVVGAGSAFLLNQRGGNYWLTVSDHQHGNGSVVAGPESAHIHSYGNEARYTGPSTGGSATFGIAPNNEGRALPVGHTQQMNVPWFVTGTAPHSHTQAKTAIRPEASTDGDMGLPLSYKLTWVMRVA